MDEQTPSSTAPFEELFQRQYTVMVHFAALLTESTAAADDIVQDAFVALHRRWDRVDDPSAYLRRSVVNGARSWQRRRRRELTSIFAAGGPEPISLETTDLLDALRQLPWGQRSAVVLRYYVDLTEADIAAAMGCRPGTVKSHLHRGLAALREVIEVQAPPPTTQSSSEYAAHPTPAPPGYVAVVDGHHGNNFVGFVKKCDIQPCVTPGSPMPEHFVRNEPSPVYDPDLHTITGYEYPGKGFVPVETNPADVPNFPTWCSENGKPVPCSTQPPAP